MCKEAAFINLSISISVHARLDQKHPVNMCLSAGGTCVCVKRACWADCEHAAKILGTSCQGDSELFSKTSGHKLPRRQRVVPVVCDFFHFSSLAICISPDRCFFSDQGSSRIMNDKFLDVSSWHGPQKGFRSW